MLVATSKQPVETVIIGFFSTAFSTCRTTIGAAQPAHNRCPAVRSSSFLANSLRFTDIIILPL